MIAEYIVPSNMISVVSDNILPVYIQEPLLISKNFTILLNTLSAYSNLLISSQGMFVYKLKVW